MSSIKKPSTLNVVVVPFNAVGHVNGCRGLGFRLLAAGHRVYFLLETAFKGQLEPFGFREVIYCVSPPAVSTEQCPGGKMAQNIHTSGLLGPARDPVERLDRIAFCFTQNAGVNETFVQIDQCLRRLLANMQIDLFVTDEAYCHPAIFYSGIPWVRCWTSAPFHIVIDSDRSPVPFTGLPVNEEVSSFATSEEKEKYFKILRDMFFNARFNDLIEKMGYDRYPDDDTMMEGAASMTIYGYPKELNLDHIENHPRWFNLEVFDRIDPDATFDLKSLVGHDFFHDTLDGRWSGKWIYLSLGSMGSVDLDLMDRLTGILAGTNHKYLVSKGPRHGEFQLPHRNQWGARFLPQIQILPLMDLVITHGGNNTVTETFARGKPMVVMPLFCDQLDNAQRVAETGYGVRIDPYDFEDHQLVEAIERLLNDQELKQKLNNASNRIQNSSQEKLTLLMDRIEKIATSHRPLDQINNLVSN